MENLLESNIFRNGVAVGLNPYKTKIIKAHERKEPIIVGDNLYYLQSGNELLQKMIDEICT